LLSRHDRYADAFSTDRPSPLSFGMALELIAFDGDDTLWHNERSFVEGRRLFHQMLARTGVELTEDQIDARMNLTDVRNIDVYGYGVSSFALSLIETAIDLTDGRVRGADLRIVIDHAKQMFAEDIELFPNVEEVLAMLSLSYPLMLVTKGDLLHQTSKLERSGLRDYFRYVEVVSHKTAKTYAEILSRRAVTPSRFLMVGNALRSDVLPVVEAGGWAVHVPAALSWSHEHADVPPHVHGRYFEVTAFEHVVDIVERLDRR
jgi:putative hydrolase of the HAD superfamily